MRSVNQILASLICFVLMQLAACSSDSNRIPDQTANLEVGAGSGVIINTDDFPLVADAIIVDKDHPNASDDLDRPERGSENYPFASIQHGIGRLTHDANTLYVKPSQEPYFEPVRLRGMDKGGIAIGLAGTPTNPVVISGYPGLRMPVIDQQKSETLVGFQLTEDLQIDQLYGFQTDEPHPLAGFYILGGAEYVTIRGFEIRNATSSGIMFDQYKPTTGIIVEYNHIHHLYGVDNIGAVRLDNAQYAIVRHNILHDTYSTRGDSNPLTPEPYLLHSGIHGYRPAFCQIYNNEIYHVAKGIFEKQSDEDLRTGHSIYKNHIHDFSEFAFSMGLQGAFSPPNRDDRFCENLVVDGPNAVYINTAEDNDDQPDGVVICNNTLVRVDTLLDSDANTGIEIYNNIVYEPSTSAALISLDQRGKHQTFIDYFDHNLYFREGGGESYRFITKRYTDQLQVFADLTEWQTAYTSARAADVLNQDPDQNTITDDPLFVDITSGNYYLTANSPARNAGRSGEDLGAFTDGSEFIGPGWSISDL